LPLSRGRAPGLPLRAPGRGVQSGREALASPAGRPDRINLKCIPMLAVQLRERYAAVLPGYHMNKTHWNTVLLDGSISEREVKKLIDLSYDLVRGSLPRSKKAR